jgi:hypothetical protein
MNIEQKQKINKKLTDLWNGIYDDILTEQDKDKDGKVLSSVLFEIEEQMNRFAAGLGLAAMIHK